MFDNLINDDVEEEDGAIYNKCMILVVYHSLAAFFEIKQKWSRIKEIIKKPYVNLSILKYIAIIKVVVISNTNQEEELKLVNISDSVKGLNKSKGCDESENKSFLSSQQSDVDSNNKHRPYKIVEISGNIFGLFFKNKAYNHWDSRSS